MALAVFLTRWAVAQMVSPDVRHPLLPVFEVVAGALGYLVGAFTLARGISRELIEMVRESLRRRRGESSPPPPPGASPSPRLEQTDVAAPLRD
jgi:hypothetical protein